MIFIFGFIFGFLIFLDFVSLFILININVATS